MSQTEAPFAKVEQEKDLGAFAKNPSQKPFFLNQKQKLSDQSRTTNSGQLQQQIDSPVPFKGTQNHQNTSTPTSSSIVQNTSQSTTQSVAFKKLDFAITKPQQTSPNTEETSKNLTNLTSKTVDKRLSSNKIPVSALSDAAVSSDETAPETDSQKPSNNHAGRCTIGAHQELSSNQGSAKNLNAFGIFNSLRGTLPGSQSNNSGSNGQKPELKDFMDKQNGVNGGNDLISSNRLDVTNQERGLKGGIDSLKVASEQMVRGKTSKFGLAMKSALQRGNALDLNTSQDVEQIGGSSSQSTRLKSMPKTIGEPQKQLYNKNQAISIDQVVSEVENKEKQVADLNLKHAENKEQNSMQESVQHLSNTVQIKNVEKSQNIGIVENQSNSDICSARTLSNVSQQNLVTKQIPTTKIDESRTSQKSDLTLNANKGEFDKEIYQNDEETKKQNTEYDQSKPQLSQEPKINQKSQQIEPQSPPESNISKAQKEETMIQQSKLISKSIPIGALDSKTNIKGNLEAKSLQYHHHLQRSNTKQQNSQKSLKSYQHLSQRSGYSYSTSRTGIYKKPIWAGQTGIKVIEWYFYPNETPKKLLASRKKKTQTLEQVTGKRFEMLSQKSSQWDKTSLSMSQRQMLLGDSDYLSSQSKSTFKGTDRSTPVKQLRNMINREFDADKRKQRALDELEKHTYEESPRADLLDERHYSDRINTLNSAYKNQAQTFQDDYFGGNFYTPDKKAASRKQVKKSQNTGLIVVKPIKKLTRVPQSEYNMKKKDNGEQQMQKTSYENSRGQGFSSRENKFAQRQKKDRTNLRNLKITTSSQADQQSQKNGYLFRRSGSKKDSFNQFQNTELGANFNKIFKDKKLPFKYRTLQSLQQILLCKEVEEDIAKFRQKEPRQRKKWQYFKSMEKDITRTPLLKDSVYLHEDAHRIIEFYCYSHNVAYCQGMLEVLHPFLLMKSRDVQEAPPDEQRSLKSTAIFGSESRLECQQMMASQNQDDETKKVSSSLSSQANSRVKTSQKYSNQNEQSQDENCFDLACVYAFFKRFVKQFIPNNLHNKFDGRKNELSYLEACLNLTNILLAYSDRKIFNHFEKRDIRIEMYGPRWVTTLYSRIVELSLLYEVWEIFLFERDSFFIFYFFVALLIEYKEQILQLNLFEDLMPFLQHKVKIQSFQMLADIYFLAIQVRTNTPVSFQQLVSELGVFKYTPVTSNEELEQIQSGITTIQKYKMPIFATELLQGSQRFESQLEENNVKHKNLLVMKEDEQQIYVAPSSHNSFSSPSRNSFKQSENSRSHQSTNANVNANTNTYTNSRQIGVTQPQTNNTHTINGGQQSLNAEKVVGSGVGRGIPYTIITSQAEPMSSNTSSTQPQDTKIQHQNSCNNPMNQSGMTQKSGNSLVSHSTANQIKLSEASSESFFKQSDFIDPLMRIQKMKFLTDQKIRVGANIQFACVDIRLRKKPRLTEIFDQKALRCVPVFELSDQQCKKVVEKSFSALDGYHIVIVTSESLDCEYQGKEIELQSLQGLKRCLKNRSYWGVLKEGANEIFKETRRLKK